MKKIIAKIQKIDQNQVTLVMSDKTEIIWPKDKLPQTKIGDEIYFNILSSKEADLSNKELAKAILEDVFNSQGK